MERNKFCVFRFVIYARKRKKGFPYGKTIYTQGLQIKPKFI